MSVLCVSVSMSLLLDGVYCLTLSMTLSVYLTGSMSIFDNVYVYICQCLCLFLTVSMLAYKEYEDLKDKLEVEQTLKNKAMQYATEVRQTGLLLKVVSM